jgi:hypothetical protein
MICRVSAGRAGRGSQLPSLLPFAKARQVDFLEGPFRSEKWNRFNFAVKPRLEHGNKISNTFPDSSWQQQAVANLAERYFP